MSKENTFRLNGKVVYTFLSVFFVLISFSFIRYSFSVSVETIKDVPMEWIWAYTALLGWYATEKQMKRKKSEKTTHRKGEYFVYATWILFGIIFFFNTNGLWVKRVPENLDNFLYSVTAVFAGSELLKNWSNKIGQN